MGLIFRLLQQQLHRPNQFLRLAVLGNQECPIAGINTFLHRMPEALRRFPGQRRHETDRRTAFDAGNQYIRKFGASSADLVAFQRSYYRFGYHDSRITDWAIT